MATMTQVGDLRRMIAEPTDADPYSNSTLMAMIDDKGVAGAAAAIWESKAAEVASLVDISEGGSSRKMSELHKNFLLLADRYRAEAQPDPGAYYAPRSRRGERA